MIDFAQLFRWSC